MREKLQIAKDVERLVRKYNTRDPFEIADAMGINIAPLGSTKLAACYRYIKRNHFIFLCDKLCEEDEKMPCAMNSAMCCITRHLLKANRDFWNSRFMT